MGNERKAKVAGSYVVLPDPSSRDGKGAMVWPHPLDPSNLQYRLRYGPPLGRGELLVVASYLDAYKYLVTGLTQRTRNQRCSEIKATIKGASDAR